MKQSWQIDNEKIVIQRLLYKKIIQKDESFKVVFMDNRKIVGVDKSYYVGVLIFSKKIKNTPLINKIISSLWLFFTTPIPARNFDIQGLDDSEKFLLELKANNYPIGDCLEELKKAKLEKITFFGH